MRDAGRRENASRAVDARVRELVTERVAEIFVSWFADVDFDLESLEGRPSWRPGEGLRLKEILDQRYWAYARDAYITNRPIRVGDRVLPGPIQLNPLGAPDAECEALRPRALELVEAAYRERTEQRDGELLAIPLYSRSGARGAPVGAAFVRVDVPTVPRPSVGLDVPFVALSIGGATVAAALILFLLLHVLVLRPLEGISRGARRVSAGAFQEPVARTGRRDEIDTTIATFNDMMAEIAQSRAELEQRVAEAVERVRATERRLVLSERLAAMGTLAAGIAHEINNPLGGMMNAARALERGTLAPDAEARYLALVNDGLARIRDVVQRVLRFSRGQGARVPVDLRQVLDDAARFVNHRIQESSIRLDVRVDPELRVRGDPAALGQVVLNLLQNAMDAIEETDPQRGGARVITIRAEHRPPWVRVEVEDTGRGMSNDERERAFDLFFTTKGAGLGTGLGLSIAHQIVTEHGGALEIESAPGRGTMMRMLLPLP